MYDEYAEAFDEAEDEYGTIAGYVSILIHEDGSLTVNSLADEGTEAEKIVSGVLAAFEEPAQ